MRSSSELFHYFNCVLEHLRPTTKSQRHSGTQTKKTKLKVTVDFGMLQKQENCCVWRSSERECVARVNYFNCVLEHLSPTTKSQRHSGTHTKKTKLKVTVDFGILQKHENCCVWRSSERECVARVNYFNCVLEHLSPTTKSQRRPGTHTKKTKLKVTVDFGMLQKHENCCVWRSSERECVARVNYFNCVLEHLRPTTKSQRHPGTHTKNETESHSTFWDAPKARKLLCMEII